MNFHKVIRVILAVLASSSIAQILGCDDVQCPKNPKNSILADCRLGGVIAENIGVVNLSTGLSPHPLTWTIGQSHNEPFTNSTASLDFFLGQPSSLNLQLETNTLPDCAILFHGIAPSLRFPNTSGIDQGKETGTCADVFTMPCIKDLENQVAAIMSANMTVECSSLATLLRSMAPSSCLIQGGDWGEVSGKPISGVDLSAPSSLSDCHPTVDSSYTLTRIDGTSSLPGQVGSSAFTHFQLGITPILTVLRNASVSRPETYFTCLKVIVGEPTNKATGQTSKSTILIPNLIFSLAMVGFGILSCL